ncbi:MAG: PfkB family carbohydrate kinase [Paracoccaceae bacterium]
MTLFNGRVGIDFFPDPPGCKTEDATTMSVGMGGSSANIAAGIVKLGGQAALVTSVSDDSVGRYCLNQLRHYGIGSHYVKNVGGEARNSLAVYESRVDDHQSAFRAFELARAAGLPILFDVDYRPYSWPSAQIAEEVLSKAAALSDAIVGNDDEFGFMSGDKARGLQKARDLAQNSAQLVIYKMGEDGSITITPETEFRTGIYPVQALKPTGAGDSFMAGLVSSIAAGHSLQQAVLRGSACASITVSKPGCAPAMADSDTLATFLQNHSGPTNI